LKEFSFEHFKRSPLKKYMDFTSFLNSVEPTIKNNQGEGKEIDVVYTINEDSFFTFYTDVGLNID